jgi:hypothetical protein
MWSYKRLIYSFFIAVLPWGFIRAILMESGVYLGGLLSVGILALFMFLADKLRQKIFGPSVLKDVYRKR